MLIHPTLDKLKALRFTGMARALEEQMNMPQINDLAFEERLGLMIDREVTERKNRRLNSRLKKAKLRQQASIEDIDYRHPRGLDRSLMAQLATCTFISGHHNPQTGPTGCGKSYLSCALAQKACREGCSAQYIRLPRLLPELHIAKADGRYARLLASFAKTDLLVLDDWGLIPLNDKHRHDLLEITEDRYNPRSTVVVSQFPVENWHDLIGDPTLAGTILDRLVHNAYKITPKGDPMRKRNLTQLQPVA